MLTTEGRSCPKCGAPLEVERNRCGYCGTSYFDISCIPLGKAFYLKLNAGTETEPQFIIQKVITKGFTFTREPMCAVMYADNTPMITEEYTNATFEIEFATIGDRIIQSK